MKTRTDDEVSLNNEIKEELERLDKLIGQSSPEDVAYVVIKSFLDTESPDDSIRTDFLKWLFHPRNEKAKNAALERCFAEIMNETPTLSDNNENMAPALAGTTRPEPADA